MPTFPYFYQFSSPSLLQGFPHILPPPVITSPSPTQSPAIWAIPTATDQHSTLLPKPSAEAGDLSKPACPWHCSLPPEASWQTQLLSSGPTSHPCCHPTSSFSPCCCHHNSLHPSKSEKASSRMSGIYPFKSAQWEEAV